MALDRTWYNALVDDSGTGLDGTVWNKARINELLNSIDAELARLGGYYASGNWFPTITGASGTPVYTQQTGVWVANRDQVTITGRVTLSSKGSLSGPLSVASLPRSAHPATDAAIAFGYWGGTPAGVTGLAGLLLRGNSFFTMYKGSATVGALPLDAADISSLDIVFGGSFHGG